MNCAKRLFGLFFPVLAFVVMSSVMSNAVQAGVNFTGDVSPYDSTWWPYMDGLVGYTAAGTVTVDAGSAFNTKNSFLGGYSNLAGSSGGTGTVTVTGNSSSMSGSHCYVGYSTGGVGILNIQNGGAVYSGITIGNDSGSAGTVTVDGLGSLLDAGGSAITVGDQGQGRLNIQNDGLVNATLTTISPSSGTIYFGSGGGTLNTKSLYMATGAVLTGDGTVNTRGLVGDVDLSFDASHGVSQTLAGFGSVTLNLDVSDSSTVGDLGVGYQGTASLQIADGLAVNSQSGYLGFASGSSGTATVSGATWNLTDDLAVGYDQGAGTLNIQNGGVVSVAGKTAVAPGFGTGMINLDGGTLNTQSLRAVPTQLTGTGTINAKGLVSDINLSFDSSHGLSQTLAGFGTVALNLDMSDSNNVGDLGVGCQPYGNGTLRIADGLVVTSQSGSIGDGIAATGVATVTGSTWNINGLLSIADKGDGTLNVLNGAVVTSNKLQIAHDSGLAALHVIGSTLSTGTLTFSTTDDSSGYATIDITQGGLLDSPATVSMASTNVEVTVDGSGSTWNAGGIICSSSSELTITNGGVVNQLGSGGIFGTSPLVSILGGGNVTVTVNGSGSTWNATGGINAWEDSQLILNIQNGGLVSTGAKQVYMHGMGSINFNGGTLSTTGLSVGGTQLTGTGVINTKGLVSDADLTFDGSAIATHTFGTAITTTVNMSSFFGNGDLGAGWAGNGSLLIRNGAQVYSSNGYLGYQAGSSGTVTVDGATWTISDLLGGNLRIASKGEGIMNIQNGGIVNVAGTTYLTDLGYPAAAHAVLNIMSGGKLSTTAIEFTLGGTATVNFDDGILQAKANSSNWIGASPTGANVNVYIKAGGANFDTNGYNVTILRVLQTDSVSTGGGLTKIGAGTLTLSGANTYTGLTSITDGVLKLVDTTATWTGAFNPIFAGGSASVSSGKLLFNYGSTYDDATALLNVQSAITAGTIFEGYHTPPLYCSGNTATNTITVMNTLYGDSNVDGSVNGTDLNAVLSYYNQSGQAWANGDFNFDGSVNGTDLNTVLSNYNQNLSSSTAAVPEPSTLSLMVLGLLGLLAWRKRK